MEQKQREALQVGCLPHHLEAALAELAQDNIIRSTLGEYLFSRFYQGKLHEWERYHNIVHPWELKEYLTVYYEL
jgi:glutamine synthetase